MITKEIVNGEEFFAVDDESLPPTDSAYMRCDMTPCDADKRRDKRGVHFRPLSDLRIMAKYLLQENPHEHNTPPDRTQG